MLSPRAAKKLLDIRPGQDVPPSRVERLRRAVRSAQQAHRANDLPERFGRERVELHEEVDDEGEVVDDNGPLQPRQMIYSCCVLLKRAQGRPRNTRTGGGLCGGTKAASSKHQTASGKRLTIKMPHQITKESTFLPLPRQVAYN